MNLPDVANSDCHLIAKFGVNYTLVDAKKCNIDNTSSDYILKDVLFENYLNYCLEDGKKCEGKENLCKYMKGISDLQINPTILLNHYHRISPK